MKIEDRSTIKADRKGFSVILVPGPGDKNLEGGGISDGAAFSYFISIKAEDKINGAAFSYFINGKKKLKILEKIIKKYIIYF